MKDNDKWNGKDYFGRDDLGSRGEARYVEEHGHHPSEGWVRDCPVCNPAMSGEEESSVVLAKTELGNRYEKSRESALVTYRSSKSNPHYTGGEFIDIYINMYCPDCEEGMLMLWEDKEIVAKCHKCAYTARVSVYEEGE
jgi:DNA-directed RNA polymerase subunit M/transcription elongation factor TFIIS